jgi:hypothetical protein
MATDQATIIDEIEKVYDLLYTARKHMARNLEDMSDIEEEIKCSDDHFEEWASAKNNDIRHILVLRWIQADPDVAMRYYEARSKYRTWRSMMREDAIKAEGLKVKVGALGAGFRAGAGEAS